MAVTPNSLNNTPSDDDLALLWPQTPYACWIVETTACRCALCTAHRRVRWDSQKH